MKAAERGDLSDESIIFGRDDILFSPAENGIRSVDDNGVVGGMVDLARIQDNIDTVYGRVRNPMSEGALKYSLTDTGAVPDVMQQLGKQIDEAGDFDVVLPTGKKVTNEQIKEATDNLVSQMLDVDKKTLEQVMGNFVKGSKAGPVYKDKTAAGIVKRVINEHPGKTWLTLISFVLMLLLRLPLLDKSQTLLHRCGSWITNLVLFVHKSNSWIDLSS